MRPILLLFFCAAVLTPVLANAAATTTSTDADGALPVKFNLFVPYTTEVPDGKWVAPWNNACEEASIVMVEARYLGIRRRLGKEEAKNLMRPLFDWQDKKYGSNKDSDSERTAEIINKYSSFTATIIENPTLESIKAELREGRPVISFHYGFGLQNALLRFRRGGSSFHVMVIKGYDETKKEFIVNDSGNEKSGLDFRYKYATIMDTLSDFDHETGKADGPARVLFTAPKQIVKATGSNRLYLIEDGFKHYISHPNVFKNRRWSWSAIKTISRVELDALPLGETIIN